MQRQELRVGLKNRRADLGS